MGFIDRRCSQTRTLLSEQYDALQELVFKGPRSFERLDISSIFFDLSEFGLPRNNVVIGAREEPSCEPSVSNMILALEEMSLQEKVHYRGFPASVLRIPFTEMEMTGDHSDKKYLLVSHAIADFLERTYPGRFDDYADQLRGSECIGNSQRFFFARDDRVDVFGNPLPLINNEKSIAFNALSVLNRLNGMHKMDRLVVIWDVSWPKVLSSDNRAQELRLIDAYRRKNRQEATDEERFSVQKAGAIVANVSSLVNLCLTTGRDYQHIVASPMYGFDAIHNSLRGADWANMGAGDEILDDLSRIPMFRL